MDREILAKVINLTDNMNKKIRAFRNKGLGKFIENKLNYATAKYDKKINLTMKSGFLTKGSKELGKLSDKELNELYERLQKVNLNEGYGTVKKFEKTETKLLDKTAQGLKAVIGEDKFRELQGNKTEKEFVKEFIERKKELKNSRGITYSSNQILTMMYLEMPSKSDDEETLETLQRMERGREMLERMNNINKGKRGRNGNK